MRVHDRSHQGDRRALVNVDASFSIACAGWVFSEDDHGDLSVAEQLKVAFMGKAVSPVTSYLAVEPGTRPSTIGLPVERQSRSGYGVGSGAGGMRGRGNRVAPDLMALLAPAVKRCVASTKPPAGWAVALTVETTLDEVVDVMVRAGKDQPIARCLEEAVWALRLDGRFDQPHDTFELALH